MDVGESVDRGIGGGELGLDHVEWGFWCCSSGGVGLDLVRRYSIQVRRSFKAMVWFWRKMQQGQLLTWFSIWLKWCGDDGNDGDMDGDGFKLLWARCKARRALSSWASLSSSMNFKCWVEGDDDGEWLLFGGSGGDTFGGGDICELG